MKRYLVWCPEYGQTKDDAYEADAIDARDAALKWAKEDDEAGDGFSIADGSIMTVIVAEADNKKRQVKFTVSGEYVPRYSAREAVEP